RVQQQRDLLEQELRRGRQTKSNFALFVLSPSIRGGGTRDFTIPTGTQTVKLQVQFESDPYPRFYAELHTQTDDQPVWTGNTLRAPTEGGIKIITFRLPARLFKPQGYLINLKGVTAGGEIEDISSSTFRITMK